MTQAPHIKTQEIVQKLTAEQVQTIEGTTHPDMVTQLAKPGAAIREKLDMAKFISLMRISASMVTSGDQLDRVKKLTVYNKAEADVAFPEAYTLPSVQGLGLALQGMTDEKAHLLHMAVGFAGEATEMLRAVLDHVLGADLDLDNVVEEGGDAAFYLQGILNQVDIGMNTVLRHNKFKLLGGRYASGKYSDEQAIARADKPAGE